jgi:hypothetical protein
LKENCDGESNREPKSLQLIRSNRAIEDVKMRESVREHPMPTNNKQAATNNQQPTRKDEKQRQHVTIYNSKGLSSSLKGDKGKKMH